MALIPPPGPPALPPSIAAARAESEAPGRRIKSGDTLGAIAKQMVTDSGAPVTKANVAKALAALEKANPALAADGGRKMKIGAPVTVPTLDANGGWASAGPANAASKPNAASAAAATQQMQTLQLERELSDAAKGLSSFMAVPTPEQIKGAAALLKKLETSAPQLLETPAARLLKARLIGTEAAGRTVVEKLQGPPSELSAPAAAAVNELADR